MQEAYGRSVIDSAAALCPEMRLQRKPSANEVHISKRSRDRQIRNNENSVLASVIPRQILSSSSTSASSYLWQRKEVYFTKPTQVERAKSHSPAVANLHWDVPAAMEMLRNWPEGQKVNWSAEAERLGIQGGNRGQVLKETAVRHNIDTVALDGRSSQRLRAHKRRLVGSDISVGCAPSKKALQNTWADMIESG